MNFFEGQDLARRNTRVMVVLFFAAVLGIVVAVDLVVSGAWLWASPDILVLRDARSLGKWLAAVPAWVHFASVAVTVVTILAVSSWKIIVLRAGGGAAVAKMMGGRRVLPGSNDPLERRLLNVVEEMAIAAGSRVPEVYVMDEERGINAFAAGYDVSSAAVAVTRGTLETLNRQELQGVIGHEFSHVVNGDMSLNIRMMGVLAGIVFIGAMGGFIMRTVEGRSKEAGAIGMIGLGLFLIGYIGLFFARIIKAMVSRQREYLADSSGVQFTRNPEGLAGALDQISLNSQASLVRSRHAEDASHMFFGEAIKLGMAGVFSTHPPIAERIARIDPRFKPDDYRSKRGGGVADAGAQPELGAAEAPLAEAAMGFAGAAGVRRSDLVRKWDKSPAESTALVGTVGGAQIEAAQRVLAAIPPALRERIREADGAAATVLALILAHNDEVMNLQLDAARVAGGTALAEAAAAAAREMRSVGPAYYVPIVDLALPALKLAPPDKQNALLNALQATIYADRRMSLFEFVLFMLMKSQIGARPRFAAPKYKSLAEVPGEAVFLLSLMAYAGGRHGPNAEQEINAAFDVGAKEAGIVGATAVRPTSLRMEDASAALEKLRDLAPMAKSHLVRSLFATATSDGTIRIIEAGLMRAVGAVLDCPLPPLLEQMAPDALAA